MPHFFFLSLLLSSHLVLGGDTPIGGPCSIHANRLDPSTHKFLTDCDNHGFCSPSTSKCEPKLCRKDEYPFGYKPEDILPPMCDRTKEFCPDEESGCQPLKKIGELCQLNRDDECAPPTLTQGPLEPIVNQTQPIGRPGSGSQIPFGLPSQLQLGSICLHLICTPATAPLGAACSIDETLYVLLGPGGQQFNNIVTRDDCIRPRFQTRRDDPAVGLGFGGGHIEESSGSGLEVPNTYCDSERKICVSSKLSGEPCAADKECVSENCNTSNVCTDAPETPLTVAPWQYALTSIFTFAAVVAIWTLLFLLHKRHRARRREEVLEYYREQTGHVDSLCTNSVLLSLSYRNSIIALHSAAARRSASLLSRESKGKWKSSAEVAGLGIMTER